MRYPTVTVMLNLQEVESPRQLPDDSTTRCALDSCNEYISLITVHSHRVATFSVT